MPIKQATLCKQETTGASGTKVRASGGPLLQHGDRITVRRSEHHVRFLHPVGWSYFDTLREKLQWNTGGS